MNVLIEQYLTLIQVEQSEIKELKIQKKKLQIDIINIDNVLIEHQITVDKKTEELHKLLVNGGLINSKDIDLVKIKKIIPNLKKV